MLRFGIVSLVVLASVLPSSLFAQCGTGNCLSRGTNIQFWSSGNVQQAAVTQHRILRPDSQVVLSVSDSACCGTPTPAPVVAEPLCCGQAPQATTYPSAGFQATVVVQHQQQRKAEIMARAGRMWHVGGGYNGSAEGVGFSSVSAQDAIRRCCYYGRRQPTEIGVARGPNGWYASIAFQ